MNNKLSTREATSLAVTARNIAKAAGWPVGETLNREAWLTQFANAWIWPLLEKHEGVKPRLWRVSVGFPKGSRGGKHAIGQCWDPGSSGDSAYEIFISPELAALDAVDTLVHEAVHASVGIKAGHKAPFKRLALAVGLEGKMTSASAGPALKILLATWVTAMPPFPGAPLSVVKAGGSKPGSRLLKASCQGCEYTVRVTAKWLAVGIPHCPNQDCTYYAEPMLTPDQESG